MMRTMKFAIPMLLVLATSPEPGPPQWKSVGDTVTCPNAIEERHYDTPSSYNSVYCKFETGEFYVFVITSTNVHCAAYNSESLTCTDPIY